MVTVWVLGTVVVGMVVLLVAVMVLGTVVVGMVVLLVTVWGLGTVVVGMVVLLVAVMALGTVVVGMTVLVVAVYPQIPPSTQASPQTPRKTLPNTKKTVLKNKTLTAILLIGL